MNKPKTMLPWKLSPKAIGIVTDNAIVEEDGYLSRGFLVAGGLHPRDAGYIVRACNSHEALVALYDELQAIQDDAVSAGLFPENKERPHFYSAEIMRRIHKLDGLLEAARDALKLAKS